MNRKSYDTTFFHGVTVSLATQSDPHDLTPSISRKKQHRGDISNLLNQTVTVWMYAQKLHNLSCVTLCIYAQPPYGRITKLHRF